MSEVRASVQPAGLLWQDAATLAMEAVSARIDTSRGGQPWFWLNLTTDPPRLEHQSWDYCDMSGRWVNGLLLGRLMTGSTRHMEQEAGLRQFLLQRANSRDGLFYNAEAPDIGSHRSADIFCQSRALLGMLSWWMETGDGQLEGTIDALVRGLHEAARWDGQFAHYPATLRSDGCWLNQPDSTAELDPKVEPALGAPGYRTTMIGGLMKYYELSGSRTALALAGGLTRHYVRRSGAVNPDGTYIGHTHSGGVLPTTAGILRYGLATSDDDLVRWAQRVFDYTESQATSFGWLSDGVGFPHDYFWSQFCETCALTDYLELGILLSEVGLGDYWDTIERCARNQLLANQFTDAGCLPAGASDQVVRSVPGSFACSSRPNSLLGWDEGLEGCCIGSGLHALYLVWSHAVTEHGGTVTVNLPISRTSESVEVTSDEPYVGGLSVRVRRPCTLDLRLPEHARGEGSRVRLNGTPQGDTLSAGRHTLADLQPGDEVTISYPLPERTERILVAGHEYLVAWKGSTVLAVDPVGERAPAYQRSGFRAAEAPAASQVYSPSQQMIPW